MQNEDNHGTYFTELLGGLEELIYVKSWEEFWVLRKDSVHLLLWFLDCLIKCVSLDTPVLWNPCWNAECENCCNNDTGWFLLKTVSNFRKWYTNTVWSQEFFLVFYLSMYKRKNTFKYRWRSLVGRLFHEKMTSSVSSPSQSPSPPMFWELWGRDRRDVEGRHCK